MNRDLFLAVLSMDSYNRGYNSGIEIEGGANRSIGTATFIADKGDAAAQAESFYAVAYSWNGEKVISYRGTDDVSFNFTPTDLDDWLGGTGSSTGQAGLAAKFYQDMSPGDIYPDIHNTSVTFTGHSLGGGLAGMLGSLYGREAIVFDNMAYGGAAQGVYQAATTPTRIVIGEDGQTYEVPDPNYQAALDTYYGTAEPAALNPSNISGWQVSGQALQFTQSSGAVLGSGLDLSGWLGPIDRHSMSLLVTLMYADQNVANQSWKEIAGPLLAQLYDADIAEAAGITKSGSSEINEAMRTMIAYTVLDDGERPFGNAAIRVMFDDANQVGSLFSDSSKSLVTTDLYSGSTSEKTFETSLSKIIVQNAAQLAKNETMLGSSDKSITVSPNPSEENPDSYVAISVDKAATAWSGATSIVGFNELKTNIRGLLLNSQTSIEDEAQTILDNVDFVVFAQTGPVNSDEIKSSFVTGYHLEDASKASVLAIGTTENDHLTGTANNDFIIGGGGTDTLVGSEGKDALYGGADADVLVLGKIDGQNSASETTELEVIDGGSGSDYLVITGAEGDKIKAGEGDTDDRLLIHAEFLGLPAGSDGKIPLFALLGGLSEDVKYSDSHDGSNPYTLEDIDPEYYLITDPATGEKYRRYDYYGNPNESTSTHFGIEYHKYENSARLEILIFADPDSLEATQTIVIENFSDGDYGIHLMGPYYPTTMVPSDEEGSGNEGPGFITDEGQLALLRAAAIATSLNATSYSFSTESGGISMQSSMMAFSSFATETITAENLKMGIDGGAEDDRLEGNDVAELIGGGAGNDRIFGRGGNDRVDGGAGNDRIEGGAGADVIGWRRRNGYC